ncbi:MAG: helix-turn-helix transcriptional regulator [Treponema sp.]|jgi:transcriptional regulator with XRE-family HTH domain|nr:helix-turn-helix transcriptional regulator [Treponema sp.]
METAELNIRDILASNIKENRRKHGFSQEKLAEKAGISTPFVAMIEVSRKFPTPEVLDRIAGALNIKTHQLFAVPVSPEDAMERLHDTLAANLERLIGEAVKKAVTENCLYGPPAGSKSPTLS